MQSVARVAGDQLELDLDRLLTPRLLDDALQLVRRELGSIVREVFGRRGLRAAATGKDACPAIADAIRIVEARVVSWAQAESPLEWLFWLRRLPPRVFEGDLRSTEGYDLTLAEVLSARSGATIAPVITPTSVRFPLRPATPQHIARFAQGVRFISELHVAYRWAGKGGLTVCRRDGTLDRVVPLAVRRSARAYDERCDRAGDQQRSGTVLIRPSDAGAESPYEIIGVWKIRPTMLQAEIDGTRVAVLARYFLRRSTIEPLAVFSASFPERLWPEEVDDLLLVARIAFIYLARHRAGIASLLQRGYLVADRQFFEGHGDEVLREPGDFLDGFMKQRAGVSAREVLAACQQRKGSAWPLHAGPVVRSSGIAMCLDLAALTNRLHTLLEFPKATGDTANQRSSHFEQVVQAAIDASPWSPRPELRELRGRPLRRGGRPITDADAIGERNGLLLLVSCKSVVYSEDYDRGEHVAVRNAESVVVDAVTVWRQKVALLLQSRGDNFDFTPFRGVLTTVCTPHVVYVSSDDVTAAGDGLRACLSLDELVAWLAW